MKIARPGSLRIDRETLLADARDRLEQRLPLWASGLAGDPTDPGWMLLEEAAWMVEMLSEQLDQYPLAVVQQLLHLIGGERLPALPAVGAVALAPASPGVLRERPGSPGDLRFLSAQTESRDAIAFVLAEPAVPVRPGLVASLVEIADGVLYRAGRAWGEGPVGELVRRDAPRSASEVLAEERVVFRLVSANPDRTLAAAQDAVARLSAEGPGWLRLSAARSGEGALEITARIDPAGAFRGTSEGFTRGGDLEGRWGSLEDNRWTPGVRLSEDPRLPLAMRGTRPQPGLTEGAILLPDLPANLPISALLVRLAAPIPAAVREALWRALVHQNLELAPLRPLVRHLVEPVRGPGEPRWLEAALASGEWATIASEARAVAEIRLPVSARGAGQIRIAVQRSAAAEGLAGLRALGLEAGGALGALPLTLAWRLPVPASVHEQRLDELVAFEATLTDAHEGLLLISDRPVAAVVLNPALVINAPVIQDGRRVPIERTVPESVSLRAEDIVGPDVRERMLASPLPPEARALLARLPLGTFALNTGEEIRDFDGVSLDASQGQVVLNAPDARGHAARLRRGQSLTLGWYRRTDGAAGNLGPGEIAHIDQRAGDRPRLIGVANPTPTRFGADREGEAEAVDRLFGASPELPVLASDWERLLRQALSGRAQGWVVRCWTYAERTLVSHALWPFDDDAETLTLRRSLGEAGPETLLVVLGPTDQVLGDEELAWARQGIEAVLRRVRDRLPTLRKAIVTRFWPLALAAGTLAESPCWDAGSLSGTLVDPHGRRAAPPQMGLLLNAAAVRVQGAEGWAR